MLRASLFFLLIPVILFSFSIRSNISIRLGSNQTGFLKDFYLIYELPKEEEILKASISDYDFSKTSALFQVTNLSGNSFFLRIKSFETSNFNVPSLLITSVSNSRTNEFLTPEIFITQRPISILISNLAPLEDIYSIRDGRLFWVLLILLFLVLALLFGIYWLGKRKKKGQLAVHPSQAQIDPYAEAFEALALLKRVPVSELNQKEIFIKISEVVRRFIERVFRFPALEMSTSEIAAYLKKESKKNPFLEEMKDPASRVFKICDRVKYARHHPTEEQKEDALTESFEFVEKTRLVFQEKDNGGQA
jgi:hypothetical protein